MTWVYDEQKTSKSEMEYRQPHEIANRLLEARLELHANLALETELIERIAELPEDDFCHTARESFQMGAGYAWQQREAEEPALEDIFATYFATQPQNRYLDYEVVELERKTISKAALELLETGETPTLESHIDPYRVEAAAAFTEGYLITASMVLSPPNETEVA
jgi:hypothetical protein